MPKANMSAAVAKHILAKRLRALRHSARLSMIDVGHRLDWSEAKVSRIETGVSGVRQSDVVAMAHVYGVEEPIRSELMALAVATRHRDWTETYGLEPKDFKTYVSLECGAVEVREYAAVTVPDLLQTAAYTTSLLRDGEGLDARLVERECEVIRLRRDGCFEGEVSYTVVVDESVLLRTVDGQSVMNEQIAFLAETASREHVYVQVLQLDAPRQLARLGSFSVLILGDELEPAGFVNHWPAKQLVRGEPVKAMLAHHSVLRAVALDRVDSLALLQRMSN